MMHLSDIHHYERCLRLLWLNAYEPLPYEPYVYWNESMSELVKQYFALDTYYEGHVGDDPQLALDACAQYDILLNARFAYHDIRIKVSMMKRVKDAWELYFFYPILYPKESNAEKIADTLCILKKLHIPVQDVNIIHLNADYIRGESLNVQELLTVTPYLYNRKNKAGHTVMELVAQSKRNVLKSAKKAAQILQGECPTAHLSIACTKGGKCRYYDHCFPDQGADTSVLHLIQTAHKQDLLKQGYADMCDIDMALLEGTRQQYAQIMAARNGGFYMDYFAVHNWLKQNIVYPISYLDFEWETFAYPPYEKMRPFDVLVFQYSLHVEKEEHELSHHEFIGQGDCRIAFIERLLHDIPKEGTILVYNMEGAEKLRLLQLCEQFPQYRDALTALCERMVDLALPFETGNLYDSRMRGYHSLKVLASIFSELDYHSLDISQGIQAANGWRMLEQCKDEAQAEQLKASLFAYCAMDTYAEYLVLHKMMDLVKERAGSFKQKDTSLG